jgi:hypothetical protein
VSRQHFWRYLDCSEQAHSGRIEENRSVITNLIQCQPDTPRVVPADGEVDIFALKAPVRREDLKRVCFAYVWC